MQKYCQRLLHDRTGATAIEYGMIIGLIAAAVVFGLSDFSNQLVNTYLIVNTFASDAQGSH